MNEEILQKLKDYDEVASDIIASYSAVSKLIEGYQYEQPITTLLDNVFYQLRHKQIDLAMELAAKCGVKSNQDIFDLRLKMRMD